MEWTLATPFIDRLDVLPYYLEALERINIPRHKINLLWVDLSGNPEFNKVLEDWILGNGSAFKSTQILKPDLETFLEDIDGEGVPDYYARRVAIGHTMNVINQNRRGHLLLWEDDIIPPQDAFTKCESLFWDDQVKAVTTVQYSRRTCWAGHVLAWNYDYKRVFPEGDKCNEMKWQAIHLENEKSIGVEPIGASATGFILIKSDFLDGYSFNGVIEGQDVQLGKDIGGYNQHRWNPTGNYLLLNWGVKTVHIGYDDNGAMKFYRSPLCKTEVWLDNERVS